MEWVPWLGNQPKEKKTLEIGATRKRKFSLPQNNQSFKKIEWKPAMLKERIEENMRKALLRKQQLIKARANREAALLRKAEILRQRLAAETANTTECNPKKLEFS